MNVNDLSLEQQLAVCDHNLAHYKKIREAEASAKKSQQRREYKEKPMGKFEITVVPTGKKKGHRFICQLTDQTARHIAKTFLVKPFRLKEGTHHNVIMDGTLAVAGF